MTVKEKHIERFKTFRFW